MSDIADITPGGSLRDRIRAADDTEAELVTIPEWDAVELRVVSMSAGQRATVFEALQKNDGNIPLTLFWETALLHCVQDPATMAPVFEPSDKSWLMEEKSAEVIQRICDVCLRISGMTDDANDEAGKDS